jgi:hypothetical protein
LFINTYTSNDNLTFSLKFKEIKFRLTQFIDLFSFNSNNPETSLIDIFSHSFGYIFQNMIAISSFELPLNLFLILIANLGSMSSSSSNKLLSLLMESLNFFLYTLKRRRSGSKISLLLLTLNGSSS